MAAFTEPPAIDNSQNSEICRADIHFQDIPWLDHMSATPRSNHDDDGGSVVTDPNPPTIAAFSPVTLSNASSVNKKRSTILVHQKSPLLLATPPQVTRALAYSHPFLLPLNHIVGLLTWTTNDPWESFLLVSGFWAVVLYGDAIMRWAGPIVIVMTLILGMYSRRYSPLSSTSLTGEKQNKKHKKANSEATNTKHQKTLDEIVDTLKVFTSRCNVLLDPLLELTDFLSTQRTATSATTRPALTTLLIRILLITPLWVILTLEPIRIITTRRIILVAGTLFLTWHSRAMKVSRTIMWRSSTIRRFCAFMTGLHFMDNLTPSQTGINGNRPSLSRKASEDPEKTPTATSIGSKRRPDTPGVRFTFILYENQRRWIGLGWTTNLLAYERSAWTDEQLNPAPSKDNFELPDVEGGGARWRWVEGSQWLVEGAGEYDEGGPKAKTDGSANGGSGWIYYDNKWQNGRRGQDGWGRYTRRRKWYRDAELVEVTPSTEITPPQTPTPPESNISTGSAAMKIPAPPQTIPEEPPPEYSSSWKSDNGSSSIRSFKSGSLRTGRSRRSTLTLSSDDDRPHTAKEVDWGIGDDARMGLE
ncbi:integral peroxisomal membrane peroxin-domain-containing protein [Xylogone sp. PMI_703]|nr:integral peroxisomal membrane peroxin-domain-containing protein [Xylogone sp. PMI_703]